MRSIESMIHEGRGSVGYSKPPKIGFWEKVGIAFRWAFFGVLDFIDFKLERKM